MRLTRTARPARPRRSALSVPAINERALSKALGLDADVLIFDLEDSVAEEKKAEARDNLKRLFEAPRSTSNGPERVVRVNAADSRHFHDDLELVIALRPDALLLPKVESPRNILDTADRLSERDDLDGLKIWSMMETPKALLNAGLIAEAAHTSGARLEAFVIGLNDLRKETGVLPEAGRTHLLPWMMQILLAGRAYGLDVLDSVSNDFRDMASFSSECAQGRAMGFDGKMLIHPAQIEPANRAFGPSPDAIDEARLTVHAFADPAAEGLGVIAVNGRMLERLHLEEARHLLAYQDLIERRKTL